MIIKKSPEEIERMAAAGAILVKTMNLLAGKIRPGSRLASSTGRPRSSSDPKVASRPSRAIAGSPARSAPRRTR